jgi:EAL domain-containing protein (putative c-di-GMP-specific phosphodiesterase class I)
MALHLFSPLGHSASKMSGLAEEAGLSPSPRPEKGAFALRTDIAAWRRAIPKLSAGLSRVEREAIRVIVSGADVEPTLGDVARMVTLEQFIARCRSEWLIDAVEREALAVVFEPVGYADAPDEAFAQLAEVGAAAPDGRRAGTRELFALAHDADFHAALDRSARLASIRAAAEIAAPGPYFIHFSPSAIYDPRFCLRTTVAEADQRGVAREDIVFSILPSGGGADLDHLEDVLSYYVENGFRTALTMSSGHNASLDMLQRLKPSVLILDAALMVGILSDEGREVVARKTLEIAQRLQIDTLARGVDDAATCEWAYGHGASFVQGAHVTAAALRRAS